MIDTTSPPITFEAIYFLNNNNNKKKNVTKIVETNERALEPRLRNEIISVYHN